MGTDLATKIREWVIKMILGNAAVKKLEGYKTIIGMAGLVGCWIAQGAFNVVVSDQAVKFFEALIGVGLIHKYQRGEEGVKELKGMLESAMKDLEDLKKPK
jgi:hypothetical protein